MIHVDMRKWPDQQHWQFQAERLGEDEFGVWLYAAQGSTIQRGHEPPISLSSGFVAVIPPSEWWMAEFYWNHPSQEVYVNIGTPSQWHDNRVTSIDLDLDVARMLDASVEVLDEDEFLEHQIRYEYPVDLIAAAREAATLAGEALRNRTEPFGTAASSWLTAVRSL